jgi:hypothetical protein
MWLSWDFRSAKVPGKKGVVGGGRLAGARRRPPARGLVAAVGSGELVHVGSHGPGQVLAAQARRLAV